FFFFFQAEDGIRDKLVTGVQTCALPISNQFRGSKQLFFSAYFLHTTNLLDTGKSSAYALRVDYPNDRWNAGALYRGVQRNFNPRSEERRVGKECRSRWAREHEKKEC